MSAALLYGGRSSMSSVGESVARLRLARLSMMRFTHSICTAVSGDSCETGSAVDDDSPATMGPYTAWRRGKNVNPIPSAAGGIIAWHIEMPHQHSAGQSQTDLAARASA